MSIQRLQSHWGLTKMPFGRSLAPSMLHRHGAHAEAVTRIGWCIDQHALGVITGEVGAGKTVAVRAATAALDTSRHVVIYLPNPSVGVRGMLHHVVSTLGQVPSFYTATLVPQAADALAAEHAERGRTPISRNRLPRFPISRSERHRPEAGSVALQARLSAARQGSEVRCIAVGAVSTTTRLARYPDQVGPGIR
jgi:ABC-type dipeptide/oligopeptide/nickel transport system ATPase component